MIAAIAAQVPGFTPGPGWNLIADVQDMLSFTFMRNAFAAGTASASVPGPTAFAAPRAAVAASISASLVVPSPGNLASPADTVKRCPPQAVEPS